MSIEQQKLVDFCIVSALEETVVAMRVAVDNFYKESKALERILKPCSL